jgi:hypothetical protein
MFCILLYCTVLNCTLFYCTLLQSTLLYYTVHYCNPQLHCGSCVLCFINNALRSLRYQFQSWMQHWMFWSVLLTQYCAGGKIEKNEMGGACGAYGVGERYAQGYGKPEGKRALGRPRRRWEDNIEMDLEEVGGICGDWMELARDRDGWRTLVGAVRNLRVPKMRGIPWLAAEPVRFSRRTLLHGVSK